MDRDLLMAVLAMDTYDRPIDGSIDQSVVGLRTPSGRDTVGSSVMLGRVTVLLGTVRPRGDLGFINIANPERSGAHFSFGAVTDTNALDPVPYFLAA